VRPKGDVSLTTPQTGSANVQRIAGAAALYAQLERAVLALYYQDRRAWIAVMKGAIGKCASLFNSHRMMRRYAVDAYLH
jgi:glucan phosphorylase